MDEQNVIYLQDGLQFINKNGKLLATCYKMSKSLKTHQVKKKSTKVWLLYDSILMLCPERVKGKFLEKNIK